MARYNPHNLAMGILLTIVTLFSTSFLFSSQPLLGYDYLLYFLPNRAFLKQELLNNHVLPLWNPYLFSGTPFLANPQTAFFYPLTWLFLIFDVKFAYGYMIFLHLILAALFMYYLGRTIGLQPEGSLVASLIFTFGGFPQAHILAGHLTFWQAYVWLPLIVAFYLKGYQNSCPKYFWATGLAIGLQLLAGFPQLSFYSLLTLMLLGIYLGFSEKKEPQMLPISMKITSTPTLTSPIKGEEPKESPMELPSPGGRGQGEGVFHASWLQPQGLAWVFNKKFLWRLIHPALPIALGLGLAAVQLLPSLQFAGLSTRSYGLDYDFSTRDSLHPYNLLTLFMPTFFGTSMDGNYWGGEGEWQFWEFSHYLGIFPLLFLIFLKLKPRGMRFFLILALGALFLAMGKYNPLYRYIYYLPGFHHFRLPAQILYLFTFALALLSAKGMEDFLDNAGKFSKRIIIICSLVGLLLVAVPIFKIYDVKIFRFIISFLIQKQLTLQDYLVLATRYSIAWQSFLFFTLVAALSAVILTLTKLGLLHKKLVLPLIMLTLVVDLWSFAFRFVKTEETQLKDQNSSPFLEYLGRDHRGYRTLDLADYFLPNEELNARVHTIEGYDPLFLRRYLEFINRVLENPKDQQIVNLSHLHPKNIKLINTLNVKYIIVSNGEDNREVKDILSGKEQIIRTDSFALYDNPESLPKVYVVAKVKILPPSSVLESLADGSVNLTREALVEDSYFHYLDRDVSRASDSGTFRDSSQVKTEILSYLPNSLSLKVNNDFPALLVLSDNYYPAWKAKVNGKEKKVFPVNYLFRGVSLPAGPNEITFFYSPRLFQAGGLISLGVLVIALLFLSRKTRKPSFNSGEVGKRE